MVNYIIESDTPDGILYIDTRPPRNNVLSVRGITFEPLTYHGYESSMEVIAREILNVLHSFQISDANVVLDNRK